VSVIASDTNPSDGGLCETHGMAGIRIGYVRVSTDAQYLTAERNALEALGIDPGVCTLTTAAWRES